MADSRVSLKVLKQDDYSGLLNLVQFYQMVAPFIFFAKTSECVTKAVFIWTGNQISSSAGFFGVAESGWTFGADFGERSFAKRSPN